MTLVPRQLLPPPSRFANRQRELSTLDEFLQGPDEIAPTIVLLRGQGGVGKTALALRWLDQLTDRFPDGQLYADLALSTGEPISSEDVLGQFLRALGVAPRQVPTGLAERTALFRSVTAGRAVAVLLDNAASAAQARVLVPASGSGLAVVTSRRPLLGLLAAGAHAVQVDPLDPDGALELLSYRVGNQRVRRERNPATALVHLCGGLPIALCVAAARVASRPRRPLARMVDDLSNERLRLDRLSAEEDLSVRSMFDVAYTDLDVHARRVYRTMGLHPGGLFAAEVASAALEMGVADARDALDGLVDASLLEEVDDRHYQFHDLVRVHAQDQALQHDSDHDRATVVRKMLDWYLFAARSMSEVVMPARRVLDYAFEPSADTFTLPDDVAGHEAALDWLERHRLVLIAATREAAQRQWAELAYHLADVLQPLFILHKHERQALEVGEVALRAAREWGSVRAENSTQKRLARAYAHLGRFDQAEQHAEEMLHRTRDRADRRGEASALKNLAFLQAETGQFDLAAATFDQTLAILRALGKRRGEALTLVELGRTLIRLGDFERAAERLRRARDLFASLDVPDRYNDARAAASLGAAEMYLERHDTARALLQGAVTVLAEHGAHQQRGQVHRALAELARRVGDSAEARRQDDIAEALGTAADSRWP
ncbi:tetratricopeptide repeat protein [Amycolatopsis aidingensis]|uniref:tetratricopeptide repeat protein n=1 Tax=Amycolatopsis aidingensis TaxID=2842453 RepID=UPI001C0DB101|nr:tetratricopeptide repeat protein [Amycolatopsis aidingensis]